MATQAYWEWVEKGRHYRLAKPVYELKVLAKANGVRWLGDLGSDDRSHLQADRPLDHTPFSVDAWPIPLPGYVVCAIDLANGPHSDRLLADARDGRAQWVKYLIFAGRSYSVRSGWVGKPHPDQHLHVSIRTDWIEKSIGTYNPWKRLKEIEDMKVLAMYGTDGTVFVGDFVTSRPVLQEATVHKMLAEGVNGKHLAQYYVKGGTPFDTADEMFDYIGRLQS